MLHRLSDLAECYKVLPLCAIVEGSKQKGNFQVTYVKTYPPYPWKAGTGDHSHEDPIEFINVCAQTGLVRWEMPKEKEEKNGNTN